MSDRYKIINLDKTHIPAIYSKTKHKFYKDYDAFYKHISERLYVGYNYAAWSSEDGIISIGGIVPFLPKVGCTWFVNSNHIKKHLFWFHRKMRRMMFDIMDKMDLHRLQAEVLDGYEEGNKWIKSFGFKHEGLMRKYSESGEDFNRFAYVR